MPDSCQPYSAVDFNHTDCKKKVLLLGPRAHLVCNTVLESKPFSMPGNAHKAMTQKNDTHSSNPSNQSIGRNGRQPLFS